MNRRLLLVTALSLAPFTRLWESSAQAQGPPQVDYSRWGYASYNAYLYVPGQGYLYGTAFWQYGYGGFSTTYPYWLSPANSYRILNGSVYSAGRWVPCYVYWRIGNGGFNYTLTYQYRNADAGFQTPFRSGPPSRGR